MFIRTGKIKITLEYDVYESYKTKHVVSLNKKEIEGDEELAKFLLKRIPEGYKVETCSNCSKKQHFPLGWSGIFMCSCESEPCEKCGRRPDSPFAIMNYDWFDALS